MSDATTPEEDPPGLIDESQSESDLSDDEDYEPPPRRRRRRRKKKRKVCGKAGKRKHKARTKTSQKKQRRKVVARNTTYASKHKCLDKDTIKELFQHGICGCAKKCIHRLKLLQEDGALDMIYSLRQQRFACKSFAHMTCVASRHFRWKGSCLLHALIFDTPG